MMKGYLTQFGHLIANATFPQVMLLVFSFPTDDVVFRLISFVCLHLACHSAEKVAGWAEKDGKEDTRHPNKINPVSDDRIGIKGFSR